MIVSDCAQQILSTFFGSTFWAFSISFGTFCIFAATVLFFALGIIRSHAFNNSTHISFQQDIEYPKVSIVMACKGSHERSLPNFVRNLQMEYSGELEYIFVVEDPKDEANKVIKEAISIVSQINPYLKAKIAVSGRSYHNAQKIHNMIYGVTNSSPDSEYVLFLDDDVYVFNGLINELVTPLINEPDKILLSTGYEFVVPSKDASIFAHGLMLYRLHNLFSFITNRPILVWGGCWLAPLRIFRRNFGSIVDCYLDGGYSDDTIISTIVQQHGYVCHHPFRATFPASAGHDYSFSRYYDFLKRQFFVLDTYSTPYNKRVCHSLAFLIVSSITLMAIWSCFGPVIVALSLIAFPSKHFQFNLVIIVSFISCVVWILFCGSAYYATNVMTAIANSIRDAKDQVVNGFSFVKFYLGCFIHLIVMPFLVIRNLIKDDVVWANVHYFKKNGKICKVARSNQYGELVLGNFSQSISNVLKDEAFQSFFRQLL